MIFRNSLSIFCEFNKFDIFLGLHLQSHGGHWHSDNNLNKIKQHDHICYKHRYFQMLLRYSHDSLVLKGDSFGC